MKNLNKYITEKFKLNSKNISKYNYYPKNRQELVEIIAKKYQKYKDNNDYILDLNDIDISNVKDLSYLFELINPKAVDMNMWDTSHVTDIHGLFWCNKITEEIYIDNWDVSNVESAYGAFYFCIKVKELNLDNWNFKNCKEFDIMFKGCENLDTKFTDNWIMPKHPITTDSMFEGCKYKPKWYNN